MAQKRTPMKKIREIIRLSEIGKLSIRQIARALKVSRPVVNQYLIDFRAVGLSYDQIKDMSDSKLLSIFEKKKEKNNRYEDLLERFPYITKELKRTGVTLYNLWEEYSRENPAGYSYSQFCYHYQVWRNSQDITMHIEHKAGDKMFVDYAGKKFTIYDRQTNKGREVETFVAILGSSNLTYVEVSESQQSQDWIRSNENAFHYFGGVTRAIVPDNLKSGVKKADKYEPDINPVYNDFAEHYRTVILPSRSRHPKDKALVENAVKLIYQRVYAPLRNQGFYSLEELNQAIRDLLEEHNNKPFQRLKYSRRTLFDETEKAVLKTLPRDPYPMKSFKKLTVQFNYHVELREDRHYYSVPWQLKGQKVNVIYDERNVAIYHDNIRIVQHQRSYKPNGYSTRECHMPTDHQFYAGWSPTRFLNWADKIGDGVKLVIEYVLDNREHPEQAFKVCMGILNLVKSYGASRLNKACHRAGLAGLYTLKGIKNILVHNLEEERQPELDFSLPNHENIRGNKYYA